MSHNQESPLEAFFFRRIPAHGFGLMRVIWAGGALLFFLHLWHDIERYFSMEGVIPRDLYSAVFRNEYRFSILDLITDPGIVFGVYLLLLLSLVLCMLGIFPRITTIISFLLMASFHERNLLILGGGDTVFRTVGFILCISPGIGMYSVMRLRAQWHSWKTDGTLLEPLTMSIWPYRLLLWQVIVIYTASGLSKLTGTMWVSGTAVAPVLRHTHFARWSDPIMNALTSLSPFISLFTMVFLLSWVFLLVPRAISQKLPVQFPLKRTLMLMGILFHGGILVLMDVGSFPAAMAAMYCGLLLSEDREAIRSFFNKHVKSLIVYYDGKCSFCRRSLFFLELTDHLHRLEFKDFHTHPPSHIPISKLEQEIHVISDHGQTTSGFYAFRTITRSIPLFWILVPLLYFPGIPFIGVHIYKRIARQRHCLIPS